MAEDDKAAPRRPTRRAALLGLGAGVVLLPDLPPVLAAPAAEAVSLGWEPLAVLAARRTALLVALGNAAVDGDIPDDDPGWESLQAIEAKMEVTIPVTVEDAAVGLRVALQTLQQDGVQGLAVGLVGGVAAFLARDR